MTYFSCYFTPNESRGAFRTKLGALEDEIRNYTGYVVVGGNLNAKAAEWGEDTDTRGKAVVEMAARLGRIVLNRGNVTTFRRPGYRQTIVDVTLASEGVDRRIVDWRVLEEFTASSPVHLFHGTVSNRTVE